MWKLIKEIQSTNVKINNKIKTAPIQQYYYLNENGEVKYENSLGESKILTIGDGLWVARDGDITDDHYINEIKIIGIGDHIYKLVYNSFIGIRPKGYNIHHIDYNRNNNNIDNLLCITEKEHRVIHRPLANAILSGDIPNSLEQIYNNYIDAHNSYKELEIHIGRYNEYKNKWNNYLLEQINKYNTDRHIQYTISLAEKKQRRQNQILLEKEEERQRKLDSGEYYLDNNGKLIKKNRPKWTPERRAKTMATRETSETWQQMGSKVSATLKDKWQDEDFREYMIDCYNKNK